MFRIFVFFIFFFFFNDTATTEIYTLSLHDALPIFADDHRLGSAVRGLGLASVLSPYIVENRVSEASFASLWRHELRWARTSRAMAPAGFAGSVITHTVMVTALATAVWGLDEPAWGCVGISMLLRWLSALVTARALDLPRGGLW